MERYRTETTYYHDLWANAAGYWYFGNLMGRIIIKQVITKNTQTMESNKEWWNVGLERKPDFEQCMKRIYAWYNQEIIDRFLSVFQHITLNTVKLIYWKAVRGRL